MDLLLHKKSSLEGSPQGGMPPDLNPNSRLPLTEILLYRALFRAQILFLQREIADDLRARELQQTRPAGAIASRIRSLIRGGADELLSLFNTGRSHSQLPKRVLPPKNAIFIEIEDESEDDQPSQASLQPTEHQQQLPGVETSNSSLRPSTVQLTSTPIELEQLLNPPITNPLILALFEIEAQEGLECLKSGNKRPKYLDLLEELEAQKPSFDPKKGKSAPKALASKMEEDKSDDSDDLDHAPIPKKRRLAR